MESPTSKEPTATSTPTAKKGRSGIWVVAGMATVVALLVLAGGVLAVRACYDCHSNQSSWPWYSNIAPISWLIQHDVQQGRARLNCSQWDTSGRGAGDAAEQVQRGTMPQWYYVLLHPEANLTSAEKQALIQGLQTSLGGGG